MKIVIAKGTIECKHKGVVSIEPSQTWVRIDDSPIIVDPDPEQRPISHCPLAAPTMPCKTTLQVINGYSSRLKIDGRRICLDTLLGVTVGTPPQNFYQVRTPGQEYVEVSE